MHGARHGSTEAFSPAMGHDWLLPLYDPLTRLLGVTRLHRRLIEQADVQPGHRVLEIGCGTGNLAVAVKLAQRDAEVVGLDPDPKALDRARRKVERRGLSVQWDRGSAADLPYADASFDRVLSSLMLHHLGQDEKAQALREASRVLTAGGELHLLDVGGATVAEDGFVARRLHHKPRLADNDGDRIPALMADAGFDAPTEVGHVVGRVMGRVAYYRAYRGPRDDGHASPLPEG